MLRSSGWLDVLVLSGVTSGVTGVDVTCLRAEVTLSSSLRSMLYVPSEPLVADSFPDFTHLCIVVFDTPATLAAFDSENGILTPLTDRYLITLTQLPVNVTYGFHYGQHPL